MDKKLPKVYVNQIDKKINNNKEVFYNSSRVINEEKVDFKGFKLNIHQKINQIFSSTRYVYKADVKITLKDSVINKKIIGRNKNHLITMENDLINIDDIIDIEYN